MKRPPSRPGSAMSGHSRSGMGIGGGSMDIVGDRDEGMMERGRDRSEGEKGAFGGGAGGMKFSTGRNVSLQRGFLRVCHGRSSGLILVITISGHSARPLHPLPILFGRPSPGSRRHVQLFHLKRRRLHDQRLSGQYQRIRF
jgi:hypothetical protein